MTREKFLFKHLGAGKILDIGNLGGGARIHKEIISRFPGAEVYGLDSQSAGGLGFSFPNQAAGRAEDLPYPDNHFDFIYLGEVLEHSWEPKKITDECFRALKFGGVLVLDTPNIYALSRMLRYFFTGRDIILGDPDHKIFFSRAMLSNLLDKSGFDVLDLLSDGLCTIKCRNFRLPGIGPFNYMGEHLLCACRKK
ncbi:MAG: class I SAM-dependent methyltransferase [Patescibacteria group bacterium]|jgi:2-polyprenyl-3-methyl-5-hydroxy-6-metoxy-1,4-benzoquinol methylase